MKTSIIIPTYNKEEYTIRCIDSIRKNTNDYIILWIDDASSPESIEKVQSFLEKESIPYELIAKKENSGFARSVNLGLARALALNSDFVVLQNNDTEVYGDWLNRMIDVAGRETKIGAVGPVTSPCESWQSIDNLKKEFTQFADLPPYHDNPAEYAGLISELYAQQYLIVHKRLAFFSVLFKADVIKETGMLSEEYGIGFGEDDDYILRLRQKGYFGAIAKDVFVFHNHNTTFKDTYSARQIQEMREQNRDLLYRKFKKGKYRPADIDQIWDIEEAIGYAKQLEKRVQHKDELLKDKDKELQGLNQKNNRQLVEFNLLVKEKEEQVKSTRVSLQETERRLQGKVKEKEEQLQSTRIRLQEAEQRLREVGQKNDQMKGELDWYKNTLERVYNSISWRMTRPLRKVWSLLKG